MYESFFGLNEKPFSLLPDPSFFYLSKIHREALTLVEYGLHNQSGFTVLSGEIGSGKTTLMRYLLDRLDEHFTVGLISHTHESIGQIMDWVCVAFELDAPAGDKIRQHQALVDFLLDQYRRGKKTLLIVDEAQNLGLEKLEEIRLLSNINADKDLVLQLLLLGQPQLRDQLRSPNLEQFVQRISASYHLGRLNAEETFYYIRHRLKVAGGHKSIFTPDACHAVFHYSNGIPRIINLICETALVFSYGAGRNPITGEAIDDFVRNDASNLLLSVNRSERVGPDPEIAANLEAAAEQLDAAAPPPAASETGMETSLAASEPRSIEITSSISQEPPSASATLVAEANEPPREDGSATHSPTAKDAAASSAAPDDQLPPAALIEPSHARLHRSRELIAIAAGVALGLGLAGWYLYERGSQSPRPPEPAIASEQPAPSSPATDRLPPSRSETESGETAPLFETQDRAQDRDDVRAIATAGLGLPDPRPEPQSADDGPGMTAQTAPPLASTQPTERTQTTPTAPIATSEEPPEDPSDEPAETSSADLEPSPSPDSAGDAGIEVASDDSPRPDPEGSDAGQEPSRARPEPSLSTLASALGALSYQIERDGEDSYTLDFARSIRFQDGSTELDRSAVETLTEFSELLKTYDDVRLRVLAHTDTKGSRRANMRLSEKRARRVADFIESQGVAEARISYEGRGEEEPKVDPAEERIQGPWINRRIEIELTEGP
ncbi:AAA family ATPase [Thiorhodococcus minor]|uniref:AAA family ATPase n=1 Tax=Thiorhodococcus minor TaxID=57489 RepID=A0A6M0JTB6_9GAMM|nr:AAA family ATPase [Thiorhodococcus minor]NEV60738.1 AAA family ATPase [Thiorhodococcus minor]